MTVAPTAWAAGMQAVHDQAAGAVMVEIVRPIDIPQLIAEALLGGGAASQHLRMAGQFIKAARHPSTRKPLLCVTCPRSLRRTAFSVALVIPARDDAKNAFCIGVCERCATEPVELLDKARQALTKIWPDVRQVSVHPTAGRA